MTNNKLYRIAGWCALGCVGFTVASLVFSAVTPVIGGALEILFLLTLAFVFYALYITHRSESNTLSLVALVLAGLAIVVDLLSMLSTGSAFLNNIWYLLLSLPFLIFGYLAFHSSKIPRGLAVVALVTGGLFLISGIAGFLGSQTFAGIVNLISVLAMVVWLIWLWRVFWSKKGITT